MTVGRVGNVLAFPINRARFTAEVNPEPGIVLPFPRRHVEPEPTWIPTRSDVAVLVNRLASLTDSTPKDVNTDLLRRGFPRRSRCTPDDLRAIAAYLVAELGLISGAGSAVASRSGGS